MAGEYRPTLPNYLIGNKSIYEFKNLGIYFLGVDSGGEGFFSTDTFLSINKPT
jgi:hypothetical protein